MKNIIALVFFAVLINWNEAVNSYRSASPTSVGTGNSRTGSPGTSGSSGWQSQGSPGGQGQQGSPDSAGSTTGQGQPAFVDVFDILDSDKDGRVIEANLDTASRGTFLNMYEDTKIRTIREGIKKSGPIGADRNTIKNSIGRTALGRDISPLNGHRSYTAGDLKRVLGIDIPQANKILEQRSSKTPAEVAEFLKSNNPNKKWN